MKYISLFVLILICIKANAQQFYFPKENYKDSAALAAAMPLLAEQLAHSIKEEKKGDSLYYLFISQIAAHSYQLSNKTLDTLRKVYALSDTMGLNGYALEIEVYNLVQILNPKDQASFQNLFDSIYRKKYLTLNQAEKKEAGGAAYINKGGLSQQLNEHIDTIKGSDSLNYKNAKLLVGNYVYYKVLPAIEPVTNPFYAAIEQKEYNIKNLLITMKDGSQVQAIVATKDTLHKVPAVLRFTIYINEDWAKQDAKFMADKGYVGIIAFTRGKGKSPQNIEPYEHDASDVYDLIDWISKQPYCNGSVGMWGGSYLGFTQWAAAKTMHPALKSIMPQVAVAPGVDFPYSHGIFMTEPLRWIHLTTNNKQTDYAERSDSDTIHSWHVLRQWYVSGTSSKRLDSVEGRPNMIFQRWLQHPYQDDFWKNMTCYDTDFDKVNIPVLTTTGYFDAEQTGAMYYFNEHYKHNKNANHFLVIGPYNHGGAQFSPQKTLNGYTIDSVALVSFQDLAIKWFDYTLKDSARPAFLQDKINYEVMGSNEWKHAPSLQAISNDTLTFYLDKEVKNKEYMLSNKPNEKQHIEQTINLADRSDTTKQNRVWVPERIIDSVLQTKNSLVFATPVFDTAFIINNSFYGKLDASINKKDMDVTIYMWEQMPDGRYFSLGSWIQRASLAKDRSTRQLLQPGKKELIPVTWSYLTGKKISKGSRLIITLGVNSTYETEVNYGTGKTVSEETIADAKEPLQISWFGDSFIKVQIWR